MTSEQKLGRNKFYLLTSRGNVIAKELTDEIKQSEEGEQDR